MLTRAGLLDVDWSDMMHDEEAQMRTVLVSSLFDDEDEDEDAAAENFYAVHMPQSWHLTETTNLSRKMRAMPMTTTTNLSPSKSITSISSTSLSQEPWTFVNPSSLDHIPEVRQIAKRAGGCNY